jgi:hypothetical protein
VSLTSPVYIDVDEGRKEVAINTISIIFSRNLLCDQNRPFSIIRKLESAGYK